MANPGCSHGGATHNSWRHLRGNRSCGWPTFPRVPGDHAEDLGEGHIPKSSSLANRKARIEKALSVEVVALRALKVCAIEQGFRSADIRKGDCRETHNADAYPGSTYSSQTWLSTDHTAISMGPEYIKMHLVQQCLALRCRMYFGPLKRIRQCGHRSGADADRRAFRTARRMAGSVGLGGPCLFLFSRFALLRR